MSETNLGNRGSEVSLPDSLHRQLEAYRKELWRRKLVEALAAALIGLILSFLLIFALDRLIPTSGWLRMIILSAGIILLAGFVPYWLYRWIWGHRREEQLARLISRRYPGFGDRLLGVIELQDQKSEVNSLSPRLRIAAMEAVAQESGKIDLRIALPKTRHFKIAAIATLLLVLMTLVFLLAPQAGINALKRWVMPFSDVKRYTFTQLEKAPNYLAVPIGEPFQVSLTLASESKKNPKTATGKIGTQQEVRAGLDGQEYQFSFPGQQSEGKVEFKVGDFRHELQIEPMQRPYVVESRAVIIPPKYLEIAPIDSRLEGGEISAVEGSELRLELTANRAVSKAALGPIQEINELGEIGEGSNAPRKLHVEGRTMRVESLAIGPNTLEIPFRWTDMKGLDGGEGFRLRVEGKPDRPPTSYLQGLGRQLAILPEEVIDFELSCEDDFGLRDTGVIWRSHPDAGGDDSVAGELKIGEGGPEIARSLQSVAFSPAAFGIGPQRLLLQGYTEDYFPDRGRVFSEPTLIYILSREEHAQLLKSQFDRMIGELDDLGRKELNMLDESKRLESLEGAELKEEVAKERLQELERQARENTAKMEDLKARMEDIMKGATRNGKIDKETMKNMAETLRPMQELAEEDMPEAKESLEDAGDSANTDEQAAAEMAEATKQREEVVEKLQDAVNKANQANERFEASTFVSRLKKAAAEEAAIAGSLIAQFSEILGQRLSEVDPSSGRELVKVGGQQLNTGADVRWIQEDLGHYFARTEQAIFQEVMNEMKESQINSGLEEIREMLGKNHSFLATEKASEWAELLETWAGKLGDAIDAGSPSGGGEGGGSDPEDEDFEFMLRVMKMIQQEQDLRSRTRVLEQLLRDKKNGEKDQTQGGLTK